jgi:hypothetical protein
MDEAVKKADALYEEYKVDELYELLLPFKDSKNDELLWRLARATREKSQHTADKTKANELMYDALCYVEAALELNDNNFASHKVKCHNFFPLVCILYGHCLQWRAILLDLVGEIEGHKQRIQNAFVCKEHFKVCSIESVL